MTKILILLDHIDLRSWDGKSAFETATDLDKSDKIEVESLMR